MSVQLFQFQQFLPRAGTGNDPPGNGWPRKREKPFETAGGSPFAMVHRAEAAVLMEFTTIGCSNRIQVANSNSGFKTVAFHYAIFTNTPNVPPVAPILQL